MPIDPSIKKSINDHIPLTEDQAVEVLNMSKKAISCLWITLEKEAIPKQAGEFMSLALSGINGAIAVIRNGGVVEE